MSSRCTSTPKLASNSANEPYGVCIEANQGRGTAQSQSVLLKMPILNRQSWNEKPRKRLKQLRKLNLVRRGPSTERTQALK